MTMQSIFFSIPDRLISPLVFLFFITFGVGWLLPKMWIGLEWVWWRLSLGGSMTSRSLWIYQRDYIVLIIKEKESDEGASRPLAVLLAMATRVTELPRMTREVKMMKADMVDRTFEATIERLIEGWQFGKPPQILQKYIMIIEDSVKDKDIDARLRHRASSTVSMVKYALGELREGNRLARSNWEDANRLEPSYESELKWMASYAYFNTTMFLGMFRPAMKLMAEHWSKFYAPLSKSGKENIRSQLADKITLNPVLSIPRHIILAAAFNGAPVFDEKYWPSNESYRTLSSNAGDSEIKWIDAWYEEAKNICTSEPISLNFSHAYAGFYFTLLLLEERTQETELHNKIEETFDCIEDSSPIVTRYVKYGFRGIYNLVCRQDEKALENLSLAAQFASISGNRFADCIFMCCHALAAARLDSSYKPDADHYLAEAGKLTNTIGGSFYPALWAKASSAVYELRGETGKGRRHEFKSRQGRAGDRILRLFE